MCEVCDLDGVHWRGPLEPDGVDLLFLLVQQRRWQSRYGRAIAHSESVSALKEEVRLVVRKVVAGTEQATQQPHLHAQYEGANGEGEGARGQKEEQRGAAVNYRQAEHVQQDGGARAEACEPSSAVPTTEACAKRIGGACWSCEHRRRGELQGALRPEDENAEQTSLQGRQSSQALLKNTEMARVPAIGHGRPVHEEVQKEQPS
mmetsp:Transcript_109073/g.314169  ORF Transcript_109073/g.314169 Transcript_109073/m.314169 type:complete len:204 (-) Transcript_109073:300-911(-)